MASWACPVGPPPPGAPPSPSSLRSLWLAWAPFGSSSVEHLGNPISKRQPAFPPSHAGASRSSKELCICMSPGPRSAAHQETIQAGWSFSPGSPTLAGILALGSLPSWSWPADKASPHPTLAGLQLSWKESSLLPLFHLSYTVVFVC